MAKNNAFIKYKSYKNALSKIIRQQRTVKKLGKI